MLRAQLVEHGRVIMARYKHPGDWRNGLGNSTKVHLARTKLLKIETLRLGNSAIYSGDRALLEGQAILAFAASIGLTSSMLRLEQVVNTAPYVVVPNQYFESHVLPALQKAFAA